MFFITLVITCVGVLISLGYGYVEIRNIIKSDNVQVKMTINYTMIVFVSSVFSILFLLNCNVAYFFRDEYMEIKLIFVFIWLFLLYVMYQVFDIVDYSVFHNDGDGTNGQASFFRRFASKHGWIQ